jgi:hypothetical protein
MTSSTRIAVRTDNSDGGAAGLYERMGYQRVGVIPGYALKPHGGVTGTIITSNRSVRPRDRPSTSVNRDCSRFQVSVAGP